MKHYTKKASHTGRRNAGLMFVLLIGVGSLCAPSILTFPLFASGLNRSTAGAPGSKPKPLPTVRLRAVLQLGTRSDKPLIRFSADGQILATGTGNGPVKVWQTSTGNLMGELPGTDGQSPRAFSPTNDRLLASANLKSVSLYDLSTMKLKSNILLDKPLGGLNLFGSFSPDGLAFLIYSEGKVSLWETETGRLITSLPCNGGFFQSSFSSDGKMVLSSCNGERKAKLWDARSGKAIVTFSNESNVAFSTFSPDKKTVATTTLSGQVSVWDVSSGRLIKTWQGHADVIFFAGFGTDGRVLATLSRDGNVRLWDVETGTLRGTLRVGSRADYVVFSPDSRLLVVVGEGNKREIRVWDIGTELPILSITGHRKDIRNIEFSPDGSLLVSSSDDAVNVWDVINRTHLAKLNDASFPASFSKDGRTLATSGSNGAVLLWDIVSQ